MLIKVRSEEGKWKLFDNAENVEYREKPLEVKTEKELTDLITRLDLQFKGVVSYVVPKPKQFPLKIGIITFEREEKHHLVVFSTLCYICSDTGKTMEKVSAMLSR